MKTKKLLALLISFAMVVSVFPVNAFAAHQNQQALPEAGTESFSIDYAQSSRAYNSLKEELKTYKNFSDYRQVQKDELNLILETAFHEIDKAETTEEAEAAAAKAKAEMDQVKTDAILTAEELANPAGPETDKVTIYFTMSDNNKIKYSTGNEILARVPVTAGYFDLAEYGLEKFNKLDKEGNVVKEPTLLHAMIRFVEKYYNEGKKITVPSSGLTPSKSSSATHLFMERFFGHNCNLLYHVNHEYPVMPEDEYGPDYGATADWIAINEGDLVDIELGKEDDFYRSNIFSFFTEEKAVGMTGEKIRLTLNGNAGNLSGGDKVIQLEGAEIIYSGDKGRSWVNGGRTDKQGNITLSFKKAGKYIVVNKTAGKSGENVVDNFAVATAEITVLTEDVKSVENKINRIGTVTPEKKAAVEEARKAFENLTAEEQSVVRNLDKLEEAEKILNSLVKDIEQGTVELSSRFFAKTTGGYKITATGKHINARPVVKDENGNLLEEGRDYTVSYSAPERKNPGKYTILVTGTGNYKGTAAVDFIITPAPVKDLSVRMASYEGGYDDAYLTWDKSTGASGYQIYARRPSKDSSWTTIGRTEKNSFLKKNLYDGWKYEFKVIPYYNCNNLRYTTGTGYSVVAMTTLKKVPSISASSYKGDRVRISWKNISGESGYQVRASRTGKTTYFRTTGTALNLKVSKGKKYTYKVRAYKYITKSGKSYRVYGPWSGEVTKTLK